MHELGSIDVMRPDQTLGPNASRCLRVKLYVDELPLKKGPLRRFAGIFQNSSLPRLAAPARRWWPPISYGQAAMAMISPASSTMFLAPPPINGDQSDTDGSRNFGCFDDGNVLIMPCAILVAVER
jgi:hypothetical protein